MRAMWRVQRVGRLEDGDGAARARRRRGSSVWSTSFEPLAANTIDGSTPWCAASAGPQPGGAPVGVAVPVDVGAAASASASTKPAGGGSGASLVLSRTSTVDLGRVVALHEGDVVAGLDHGGTSAWRTRIESAWAARPSASARAIDVGRGGVEALLATR